MTDYGIQPTGFVRKPSATILAEIEAAMITEFGPGVVQTPQSPFGQINGLMSDIISEMWELALDSYQSYDPDQAEGVRLDILARLRLLSRGDESDQNLRKMITNEGQSRVDVQDLYNAVNSLDGVTFANVEVNEGSEVDENGITPGSVSLAVIGGDDAEIAQTLRSHIVPGINTYGNHRVSSEIAGYCRTMTIIRPITVPVTTVLSLKEVKNVSNCPPASPNSIKEFVVEEWNRTRQNGQNVSFYSLRKIVECYFTNLQVVFFNGTRDEITYADNQDVPIGFIEIAELTTDKFSVVIS